MNLTKSSYDKSYFNTWLEKLPLEKMFNRNKLDLIHSIKHSGTLLEIGCGRGILLNELKEDYSVKGIDISNSAIKLASKYMNKSSLKVMNIESKTIQGTYDIILAFDVLEHLKKPKEAILKIKKALKKDGIFIFSVPNNYGLFGKTATYFFNHMDKTHISTYKRNKWIELIEDSGFKTEIYNQHWLGISKIGLTKHFAFNLILVCKRIK